MDVAEESTQYAKYNILVQSGTAMLAQANQTPNTCLLYTSDAADERSSVDLGGRRIIKKKNKTKLGARSQQYK